MADPALFDFSDADLAQLLEHPDFAQPAPDLLADAELQALTRGLAAQYVDVIAAFVSHAFAGHDDASAPRTQTLSALDALIRLSTETGDLEMSGRLALVHSLASAGMPRRKKQRHLFLRELREAVLALAACLTDESARRLRSLVLLEDRSPPLLAELDKLRGIGPRRLERLWCAGLFTIEAVSRAGPDEIAEVTGLPLVLARDVVQVTQRFADEERRRCVMELHHRVQEFTRALPDLANNPNASADLLQLARTSLVELQRALAELEHSRSSYELE